MRGRTECEFIGVRRICSEMEAKAIYRFEMAFPQRVPVHYYPRLAEGNPFGIAESSNMPGLCQPVLSSAILSLHLLYARCSFYPLACIAIRRSQSRCCFHSQTDSTILAPFARQHYIPRRPRHAPRRPSLQKLMSTAAPLEHFYAISRILVVG